MKNFWSDKREEFRMKVEAETASKCGKLAAEMEDELRLQIREELRASMEKEYHFKIQEVMELMNLEIRADMEKLEDKIEALEEENRVLRMANLVSIKIADKLAKE